MVLTIELENNVWSFTPSETIDGKVVINKHIWNKVEGLTIRLYGKLEIGTTYEITGRPGPPTSSSSHPPVLPHSSVSSASTLAITNIDVSQHGCIATARKFMGRSTGTTTEQVLLDHTINLLDTWRVLKPGRHEFSFNFTLPDSAHLPPSLKVKGARIHYEFVTSLKRPRDDFKIYQTPFYITSAPDEYHDEDFEEFCHPVQSKVDKRISQLLGCCMNGKITLCADLHKRVFPVGGEITFVATVRNNLRSSLEALKVNLIRNFKYKKGPFWSTKEIVAGMVGPTVQPRDSQIWNGSLRIPNTETVTNRNHQDFFEITHILQFQVRSSNHRSKDATIEFSVVLLPSTVVSALIVERPPAPTYSSIIENDDDGLPPPTYDEATTDDHSSTSQLMPT